MRPPLFIPSPDGHGNFVKMFQSDMNETNENSPSYIKNKTKWTITEEVPTSTSANGYYFVQNTDGSTTLYFVVDGLVKKLQLTPAPIGTTVNYEDLQNKPQINSIELSGNKSLDDLGIAALSAFTTLQTTVGTISGDVTALQTQVTTNATNIAGLSADVTPKITSLQNQYNTFLAFYNWQVGRDVISTLVNVTPSKQTVVCITSASETFSFTDAGIPLGQCFNIQVYNSGTSKITIALPSTSNIVLMCDSTMEIEAGKHGEINVWKTADTSYSIKTLIQD